MTPTNKSYLDIAPQTVFDYFISLIQDKNIQNNIEMEKEIEEISNSKRQKKEEIVNIRKDWENNNYQNWFLPALKKRLFKVIISLIIGLSGFLLFFIKVNLLTFSIALICFIFFVAITLWAVKSVAKDDKQNQIKAVKEKFKREITEKKKRLRNNIREAVLNQIKDDLKDQWRDYFLNLDKNYADWKNHKKEWFKKMKLSKEEKKKIKKIISVIKFIGKMLRKEKKFSKNKSLTMV